MALGILALMIASTGHGAAPSRVICELGRVVVADMPPPSDPGIYFIETNPAQDGLMKMCPHLAHKLPAGYAAADDDARSRAAEHVPTPGPQRPPAVIATIGVPLIAADGRSATVKVTTECSGMCGSGMLYRYVRTAKGWRRDGKPSPIWVS